VADHYYEYPAFVTVRADRWLNADEEPNRLTPADSVLFEALKQIERFIADNNLDIIIDIDDGEPVDVTEDRM
jgi:hypothetical protein